MNHSLSKWQIRRKVSVVMCSLFIVIHLQLQFQLICNFLCRFSMDKGVFLSIFSPQQAGQLDCYSLWLTTHWHTAGLQKHLLTSTWGQTMSKDGSMQHWDAYKLHLNNNIWINDRHLKETLSPPWVLRFISATECSTWTVCVFLAWPFTAR